MQKHIPLIVGSLGLSAMTIAALLLVFVPEHEHTVLDDIHFSAPSINTASLKDDELLGAESVRYTSDTHGYTVRFPSSWNLDDARTTTPSDVLYAPNKEVIVRIHSAPLRETTNEDLEKKADAMHEEMTSDPTFALESFQRVGWHTYPAIHAEGIRTTESGTWKIISITVFRMDKQDTFSMLFTMDSQKEVQYKDAIEQIVESLDLSKKKNQ